MSQPDFFTYFVAACAGAAGMLILSTAKSGALIGVLISVTTIPAAANVGLSAALAEPGGRVKPTSRATTRSRPSS